MSHDISSVSSAEKLDSLLPHEQQSSFHAHQDTTGNNRIRQLHVAHAIDFVIIIKCIRVAGVHAVSCNTFLQILN